MRIAIVSDTHFGDDLCVLVRPAAGTRAPELGPGYPPLRRALGSVDYLVLLGDIIDLSVASYADAYGAAKVFFSALQEDGLAGEVVYVPGNHDFDIWNVVEHQVSVINQLKQGELPRPFRRAVPGVIDAREPAPRLQLPDVHAHPDWHRSRADYGGLFLDHITLRREGGGRRGVGERLPFDFAYPNLYLVQEDGTSVVFTHGHYFEAYWTLLGEWALRLADDDLANERPGELSVQELVGVNFPLHQLACSGIGQAQPLTGLARRLQLELYAGRSERLALYLERLEASVASGRGNGVLSRLAKRWLLRLGRKRLLAALDGAERTRFSRAFLSRPAVRERFRRYYGACLGEVARLRDAHGLEVPAPGHVVFGHTHQPIPWGSDELVDTVDGRTVRFCNTGGWLLRRDAVGRLSFAGAEVVVWETGQGFRSTPIRAADVGL
jgi:hypothetical protein